MEMTNWHERQPKYTFEFEGGDLDGIAACHDEHGFAIAKGVLSRGQVAELRESIDRIMDPEKTLKPAEARFHLSFIEVSDPLLRLLEHEPLMAINRRLCDSDRLTVHRSAAILRNVGCGVGPWHTDEAIPRVPWQESNDVLNRGQSWPNGMWFYLEGTHPSRGGLAVIEDSHRPDWPGP